MARYRLGRPRRYDFDPKSLKPIVADFPNYPKTQLHGLKRIVSVEGRVVPVTSAVLRKKRRANWKAVGGETRWIQQGMRHSFCSNWLALHGDINKLVLLSGHDSTDVMWRSYHKVEKKAQAEKFWSITPPGDHANVIAFQKKQA
jgi:hypothetical protein